MEQDNTGSPEAGVFGIHPAKAALCDQTVG